MLSELVEDLEKLGADEAAKEERLQAGSLQLRQLQTASSQPPRTSGFEPGQGGSQVLDTALSIPPKHYCANFSSLGLGTNLVKHPSATKSALKGFPSGEPAAEQQACCRSRLVYRTGAKVGSVGTCCRVGRK